ncbi:hypothetical protein BH09SUM1_BH09SUM1_08710 [soil metagenome]
MQDDEPRMKKAGKEFRTEGIALAIPMVLVSFPVVGAFLGKWLGAYFGRPWFLLVGLGIGMAMGIRECIRLIKLLNRIQK